MSIKRNLDSTVNQQQRSIQPLNEHSTPPLKKQCLDSTSNKLEQYYNSIALDLKIQKNQHDLNWNEYIKFERKKFLETILNGQNFVNRLGSIVKIRDKVIKMREDQLDELEINFPAPPIITSEISMIKVKQELIEDEDAEIDQLDEDQDQDVRSIAGPSNQPLIHSNSSSPPISNLVSNSSSSHNNNNKPLALIEIESMEDNKFNTIQTFAPTPTPTPPPVAKPNGIRLPKSFTSIRKPELIVNSISPIIPDSNNYKSTVFGQALPPLLAHHKMSPFLPQPQLYPAPLTSNSNHNSPSTSTNPLPLQSNPVQQQQISSIPQQNHPQWGFKVAQNSNNRRSSAPLDTNGLEIQNFQSSSLSKSLGRAPPALTVEESKVIDQFGNQFGNQFRVDNSKIAAERAIQVAAQHQRNQQLSQQDFNAPASIQISQQLQNGRLSQSNSRASSPQYRVLPLPAALTDEQRQQQLKAKSQVEQHELQRQQKVRHDQQVIDHQLRQRRKEPQPIFQPQPQPQPQQQQQQQSLHLKLQLKQKDLEETQKREQVVQHQQQLQAQQQLQLQQQQQSEKYRLQARQQLEQQQYQLQQQQQASQPRRASIPPPPPQPLLTVTNFDTFTPAFSGILPLDHPFNNIQFLASTYVSIDDIGQRDALQKNSKEPSF